jgi:hypothetical protein
LCIEQRWLAGFGIGFTILKPSASAVEQRDPNDDAPEGMCNENEFAVRGRGNRPETYTVDCQEL